MGIKKIHDMVRLFFSKVGGLYLLVFTIALLLIDVHGVVESVRIRKLNDMVTGLSLSQLSAYAKGDIPSSAVDWKSLARYFRLILKYFPLQEDAEMFLAYCEFNGLGQQREAFEHMRHSADTVPYFFWNIYDVGIYCFKTGDIDHAISYLELALLAPSDKMLHDMANSILYRQFFPEALNSSLEFRINHARENAVLLLAAAYYMKGNYNMAEIFATKGTLIPVLADREPFYFYAGAIEAARGNSNVALSFFNQAIKAKSKNALVYLYAADILRKKGHLDEAQRMADIGQSLKQDGDPVAFPYPNHLQIIIS